MHLTQALHRALQQRPSDTAIICGDYSLTWTEFSLRAARLAAGLTSLGLRAGDRVAMLAHNRPEYFEFYYAVPWSGGVVVPLNHRLAVAELAHILNDSGARILIAERGFQEVVETLRKDTSGLETVLYFDPDSVYEESGGSDYERLIAEHSAAQDQWRGYEDLAAIVYTGGTTGLPKGVALSHRNLMVNAMGSIANYVFTDETVYLHATPLFHAAGASRVYTLVTGQTRNIILPTFDVTALLRAIEAHRVTNVLLVPTMINRLVHHPDLHKFDLTSLVAITYGASPMPQTLMRDALIALPGIQFNQSYGMTELSPAATFLPSRYHVLDGPDAGRMASCGRAIANAELRIVDANDEPVATGEIGEIVLRGPMVMQGYWNNPEATAQALRGGWYHTGDAAYLDAEGFVYIVDRIKDMVVTGGENVYCVEVENCIAQMAVVSECAVFGVPHDEWGEAVHAVVVPHVGQTLSEQEVIAHCKGLLGGFKCPRTVSIQTQPLPLSGVGKVLKTELRKPYWLGRQRQVN